VNLQTSRSGGNLSNQRHGTSGNACVKWIVAIVVCASLYLIKDMSEPWLGAYESGDGALYSAIAHNYLSYGILNMRFGQAINLAPDANLTELKFYQHHPPLFPLSVAASFALFGESEASARLVPILFTVASIILVYLLGRKIYGNSLAVIMAFIFTTFPAVLYFGRKLGYEAQTMFLILLSVWFYLRFLEHPNAWLLAALFLAIGAGLLADWPAYFLVPCLSFHYWKIGKPDRPFRKSLSFGIPLFAALIFLLFVLQSYLVDPASVRDMIGQGLVYAGLMPGNSAWALQYSEAKVSFTAIQFITRLGERMDLLFAYPVILLALSGMPVLLRSDGLKRWVPCALFFVSVIYCALFFRSTYIHMWWIYYMAAPLSIFAGSGAEALLTWQDKFSEDISPKRTWHKAAIFFLSGLVLIGSAIRLNGMHEQRTKLLPGEHYEKASFIKEVASQVKLLSKSDDLILTNLPWPGTLHILPYYAQREIVNELHTVPIVEKWLEPHGSRRVHFLFWSPMDDGYNKNALYDWLSRNGRGEELMIDQHRFFWVTLQQ
jgi:hypothetical protein